MAMTHHLQSPVRYQPRRDLNTAQHHNNSGLCANLNTPAERRTLRYPAFAVIVAIVVAAALGFAGDAAASAPIDRDQASDSIEIYVVQPGDTLWEIAGSIAMEGEDVRPLVDALQEIAGGSNLDVGQRLVIDHAMIRG